MNRVFLNGFLRSVSEPKMFNTQGNNYSFRVVVFETSTLEGTPSGMEVSTNLWDDIDLPPIGSYVKFYFTVASEKNKKDESVWYHKINLKHIEQIS